MTETVKPGGRFFSFYCMASVLFLLYCSGNHFVLKYYYSVSVISFLIFELFCLFSFRGLRLIIPRKYVYFILASAFVFIVSMVMNSFEDLSSYIAILIQLICLIIIANLIGENDFKKHFLRIIVFLAVISLFFYFLSLVTPGIAYIFPSTDRQDLNLRYYNAYIYVFWEETGWSRSFLSTRNAGIFWEPGAYAAFLNYALFLLLNENNLGKRTLPRIIMIITILTTYSVTGYAVMLFLLIHYIFRTGNKILAFGVLIPGVFLVFFVGLRNQMILTKIRDQSYFSERVSLTWIGVLLSDIRSYLVGMTFSGRNGTIWNSIIDSCFVFGIPYVVILLRSYYLSCKRFNSGIMLFICLVLIFSSEPLIWRPFFLMIPVYWMFSSYSKKTNTY